jgi:hypothetical protein
MTDVDTPAKRDQSWRTPVSIVLMVMAIILAPLTVVSAWTKAQITDTGRYVNTVAPLADDPNVQSYVATAISSGIINALDIDQRVGDLLPPALQVLGPTIDNAVEGFIDTAATRFTQSPAFKTLWVEANRAAHKAVVRILTGNPSSLDVQNSQLTLDIGSVLENFQKYLVDRGFGLADKIDLSKVDKTIVLASGDQVKNLESARQVVRLLKPLVWVLFLLLVACSVGTVLVARRRGHALIRLGLGFAITMVLVAIGINVARNAFLGALKGEIVPKNVGAALFDAIAGSLKAGFRVVFWGGIALALVVVALPLIAKRPALVRPTQIGVAVLGVALLVAWDHPTTVGVILLVLFVIGVAGSIELAHRQQRALEPPPPQDDGGSTLSPSSAS